MSEQIKSYPKILPLTGQYADLVVGPEVEVTEKVDGLEAIFLQYKEGNEARWRKAIQRRKEAGLYEGQPKDIGPIMKDIWEDLCAEEKENLKEELFGIFKKRFAYAGQAGFPEWFKTVYLLENTNVAEA